MIWVRERVVWAAGLIEGEGCITKQITTRRSREYGYWQIKVASTDLDVLVEVRAAFGCGVISPQKRAAQWKKSWHLSIYRQPEVYAVLVAIYPFLCARRKARAKEALLAMNARGPWRNGRRPRPVVVVPPGDLERYYQTLEASRMEVTSS